MNCPNCNHELVNPNGNFCPNCGQKFIRCSTCGMILSSNAKFCPKDGTRIGDSAPAKPASARPAETEPVKMKPVNKPVRPAYDEPKNSNNSNKFILIGILAALAIVLGVGSFLLTSIILGKKQQKAPTPTAFVEDTIATDTQDAEPDKADAVAEGTDTKTDTAKKQDENEAIAVDEKATEQEAVKEAEPDTVDPDDITVSVSNAKTSAYKNLKKAKITDSYASSVVPDNDPSIKNEAAQMVDGNDITSWQEGAPGDGIGEYTYFNFKKEYSVRYITFKLGNWRSQEMYDKNNRPKTLLLQLGSQEYSVTFPDGKQEFMVKFSDGLPASDIYVEIRSVYKGNDWDDTCISEMTIYTE